MMFKLKCGDYINLDLVQAIYLKVRQNKIEVVFDVGGDWEYVSEFSNETDARLEMWRVSEAINQRSDRANSSAPDEGRRLNRSDSNAPDEGGWFITANHKPEIFPDYEDTECGSSDELLMAFIRRDEFPPYVEYEVGRYRRGGRGDCEELYWENDEEPDFWRPIEHPLIDFTEIDK